MNPSFCHQRRCCEYMCPAYWPPFNKG